MTGVLVKEEESVEMFVSASFTQAEISDSRLIRQGDIYATVVLERK